MMRPEMRGTFARDKRRLEGPGAAILALLPFALVLTIASPVSAGQRVEAGPDEEESRTSRYEPTPSTDSINLRGDRAGRATADITASRDFPSVKAPTHEEKLLLDLVNVERSSRGLKPVAWDGMLSQLARLHTDDMRRVHKASHNSSKDGADYTTRLARTPFRARAAAENVAYNANVVKAHRALMASPGHRRNILDPELTAVGTAVMKEPNGEWIYVCEDFATPITWISDEEAEEKLAASLGKGRRGFLPFPEDRALSHKLDDELEKMIASGSVKSGVGAGFGAGWSMAFTSMDPSVPPTSAVERAKDAESYALAVTFRKTPRYPFGTYWAILFLKGAF
jgi:uncharacterized protein YkwD